VVAFFVEDGWHAGCARCIEILEFGGKGHTMGLHCTDEDIIMQFGLQKPAFRIIVNAGTTGGAIGYTTGLMPSLTLATGGMGGGISSDNITVYHLFNVKRIAYGLRPFEPPIVDGRRSSSVSAPAASATSEKQSTSEIEAIVRKVIREELAHKG